MSCKIRLRDFPSGHREREKRERMEEGGKEVRSVRVWAQRLQKEVNGIGIIAPLFKKEKVHRLEKQNKNKKEGMTGKPKDSSEIKPAPYKGNTVRPSGVKGNPATLESQAALCCGNMTLDTGSSDARF